jgi:RNA polymerase sigma factor (sigma-70 family)
VTADPGWLTDQFEANRNHLRAVAYRMLGSYAEADDAVQETWLRLNRAAVDDVDNIGGWLTTVVSRICLDALRSRKSRREDLTDTVAADIGPAEGGVDPAAAAVLADSVGTALLVVLETLEPSERLAFVLHDMFGVPFDDIGVIIDRSPAAARQLASRARRRIRGADAASPDPQRRRQIVAAFLAASREGRFDDLVALLDPAAVLRADGAAVTFGAEEVVRGAPAVAATFSGRAKVARLAVIDGVPGAVWVQAGSVRVAFVFQIDAERITAIDLLAEPETLSGLDLQLI